MPKTLITPSASEIHPLIAFGQTLQDTAVEHFDTPLSYGPGEYSNWNFDSSRAICEGGIALEAGRLAFIYGLSEGNKTGYSRIAASTVAGAMLSMTLAGAMRGSPFEGATYTMVVLDKDDPSVPRDIKNGYGLHGPSVDGQDVLVVAGSVFSGMRFAAMADMLRQNGGEVKDAFALVDRSQGRAAANLGRIGIQYHSLYQMDEDTGQLWVSDNVPGDFDRIRPAESERVLEALLDIGFFKIKRSGEWTFAGGQTSNNKMDFEEAYRHPKVLKLILNSLERMAAPFKADLIVPVADGANQLGLLLGVHMGLDVVYLQKEKVGPGVKTFKYRSEEDQKLVEASNGLIIVEDVSNRRTSVNGVLQITSILDKARVAVSIADRGLPGETIELPIPEKSIVKVPLSNRITPEHELYRRAVLLNE